MTSSDPAAEDPAAPSPAEPPEPQLAADEPSAPEAAPAPRTPPEPAPSAPEPAPDAPPAPAPTTTTTPRSRLPRFLRRRDDSPRPLHGTVDQVEATLRARLGLRPPGEVLDPRVRLLAWVVPAVMGLFAALLRLPRLGVPARLAFDETYYVKEAYALLTLGYEGDWTGDDANDRFRDGDFGALTEDADYVVHPPLGKWLIAIGMRLVGPENPESWRISSAVAGILMVVLVTVLAGRLFRSPLLGGVAGLLVAIDGMAITASRIGLLDIFLSVLVLAGTMLVVKDRTATRAILARRSAEEISSTGTGLLPGAGAPSVGIRWWLVAAGVVLGAACGVKWSGAYALAVLGILVFTWDTAARRAVGARAWLSDGVWRGGTPAFIALVPTAAMTYVMSWASWFASSAGYHRTWATDQRAAGETIGYPGWLPDSLVSWWDYHRMMMEFHNGLMNPHSSQGHPMLWLLQLRPTLFYRAGGEERADLGMCGDDTCIAGVTSIGNPLMWWLAVIGLGIVIYGAVRMRDWRAWLILSGYVAMWLPWVVLYSHRTIFQFYAIAFVVFVALALTYGLAWVLGILRPPTDAPVLRGDPRDDERWWWLRRHYARIEPWTAAVPQPGRHALPPDDEGELRTKVRPGVGQETTADGEGELRTQVRPGVGQETTADGEGALSTKVRPGVGQKEAAPRPRTAQLLVAEDAAVRFDRSGWVTLGIVLASLLAVSAWFYPAWTGWNLSEEAWGMRNWSG